MKLHEEKAGLENSMCGLKNELQQLKRIDCKSRMELQVLENEREVQLSEMGDFNVIKEKLGVGEPETEAELEKLNALLGDKSLETSISSLCQMNEFKKHKINN
eukprot:UN28131